jgi:hypothetical protein
VACTIADSEDIRVEHLAEAIQYRNLNRESWAGKLETQLGFFVVKFFRIIEPL